MTLPFGMDGRCMAGAIFEFGFGSGVELAPLSGRSSNCSRRPNLRLARDAGSRPADHIDQPLGT
jgi:hypothetical protein